MTEPGRQEVRERLAAVLFECEQGCDGYSVRNEVIGGRTIPCAFSEQPDETREIFLWRADKARAALSAERPEPRSPESRCEVCGWTLAKSRNDGCVPGDCSYRPREGSDEYRRIEARRAALSRVAPVKPEPQADVCMCEFGEGGSQVVSPRCRIHNPEPQGHAGDAPTKIKRCPRCNYPERSEEDEAIFARRAELLHKPRRTKAEEAELEELREAVMRMPTTRNDEDQAAMDLLRRAAETIRNLPRTPQREEPVETLRGLLIAVDGDWIVRVDESEDVNVLDWLYDYAGKPIIIEIGREPVAPQISR